MTIREVTQQFEEQFLSPYGVRSSRSRGRARPLEECPLRTPFQRDRDRIIHCKAYRRMMHKTQVFLSPEGDHYRTRLTHTQEVSQVARTIARALRLNEDLAEAIAQGHDLGHTPFGHAGEACLDKLCPLGFRHSLQSVRVAQRLERDGQGLNLTWEVCNGIACHSYGGVKAATLEGQVVCYADKFAYLNHDVEDAVRAGVLEEQELPWNVRCNLGRTKSQRLTALIQSLVETSQGRNLVALSPQTQALFEELREFLFAAVYTNPQAKQEEGKVENILGGLYRHYVHHPRELPEEYRHILEREGLHRAVCDYISGMSDRYAVGLFQTLFIPKSWSL